MVRSKVDICGGCGQPCRAEIYIGADRIPICSACHELIAESPIEWDEEITRKQLKARIIMLTVINKRSKVYKALARAEKRKAHPHEH